MKEILVINPRKKRRKNKGEKTMVKKRKTTSKPKRRRRSNPSRSRKIARRASSAVAKSFMGLNFRKALSDMPMTQIGMFAAKWAAKRLDPDATETDPTSWNYSSYVKGALGGVAAAMLMNTAKRGSGQTVLNGALNLMMYKALQNELIGKSDWAKEQFGADDDDYVPDEYLLTGQDDDIYDDDVMLLGTDQDPYMYAEDGSIVPATDDYRMQMPEVEMGGPLQPVGPLGEDILQPVGPLGAADPFTRAYNL